MKKFLLLVTALTLAQTSYAAGGKKGGVEDPKAGKTVESNKDVLVKAFKNVGLSEKLAERMVEAKVDVKPEMIRSLDLVKNDSAKKSTIEKVMERCLDTVVASNELGGSVSTSGKLIADAAKKMATEVIQSIANDKNGSMDLAKVEQVAEALSVGRDTLSNESSSMLRITEVEAILGNGKKLSDLANCF